MVQCGFLFDFIVVRIDVAKQPIEDHKLVSVDAAFNNISLSITSSRINVVEFKPKRSFEFESTPEDLKRDLSICPLRLKVFYDSVPIGMATVPWNDCFLDRINSKMGEITHIDECELVDEAEERVGTMEYICRLQCKCEEPSDEDYCLPSNKTDIKKYISKVIDPNDVLFVVAEPDKDDLSQDGDMCWNAPKPTTALDLSPYRVLNGKLVQNADAIPTCQNVECCDLLKTSQQYQELIDSLNPCGKKKEKGSKRMCQAYQHCKECPHKKKFSSHTDSCTDSFDFNDYAAQCNKYAMARAREGCPLDKQMCDEGVQLFKAPRNCPVCNEDVRWLPKLAACPKCGYKPVPVYIEKPHNENVTAEQILEEYLENRSSVSDGEYPTNPCAKKPECRCSCVKGKICANCRVRSMCGDILNKVVPEEETCGKCEDDAEEQYRLCTTSSKDCRPHLARVFSELKDLFDATALKPTRERTNEKCENLLNSPKKGNSTTKPLQRRDGGGTCRPCADMKWSDCECKNALKKRKRYKKKRYQMGAAAKIICRPSSCNPPVMPRDDMLKFHDTCLSHRKLVPSNMGWLWNAIPEMGPRWRPGAIYKPVKEIMRFFLRDFPADTIPISRPYRRNQGRGENRFEEEEDLTQHPTLHIFKKNGEIFITLRPLKNPEALKYCANPYLNMKPITFKIVKNPMAAEIARMKQCLKDMGFSKCTCNKPIVECYCRSFMDKQLLEKHMRKECEKRGLEDCCDTLRLSDSSDSEVEYDFSVTPPAGLVKRERPRLPDKVNVGTQYEQCDWNPPVLFPHPPNPFMKWINCATGNRYARRRASDLLTIGQKEAIQCAKKKAEEAERLAAERFKRGGKKAKKGASGAAKEGKENVMYKCPDGTAVNMRSYLESEKPKKKK